MGGYGIIRVVCSSYRRGLCTLLGSDIKLERGGDGGGRGSVGEGGGCWGGCGGGRRGWVVCGGRGGDAQRCGGV